MVIPLMVILLEAALEVRHLAIMYTLYKNRE